MSASDKSPSRNLGDDPSPAIRFLISAEAAMPRTLGDRVRIAAMNDVMKIAIACRMRFARDDSARLQLLDCHTCVGVFRALDEIWYRTACRIGGTYPALWETHHGVKPWTAPVVLVGRNVFERAENSRVAPGLALLLPGGRETEPDLPTLERSEIWWCTSLDRQADTITLCRYQLQPDRRHPLTREGQPKRRRVLDREAWADLFPRPTAPGKEAPSTRVAA